MIAAGAFTVAFGSTTGAAFMSGVVAGAINGAIVGAVVGGVSAAISGGDILSGIGTGALTGAATGAVMGGISEAFNTAGSATAEMEATQVAGTQSAQQVQGVNVTEAGLDVGPPQPGVLDVGPPSPTEVSGALTKTAKELNTTSAADVNKGFWGDVNMGEVGMETAKAGLGAYAEMKAAETAAEAAEVDKVGVAATTHSGAKVVADSANYLKDTTASTTTQTAGSTTTAGGVLANA